MAIQGARHHKFEQKKIKNNNFEMIGVQLILFSKKNTVQCRHPAPGKLTVRRHEPDMME